jgi:hypothetical protein
MLFGAIAARPALAGSNAALQSVRNPAGFSLLVPSSWRSADLTGTNQPSLKAVIISGDGKATLRVWVTPQTIQTADVGTFVSVFLGNIAGSAVVLGPQQSAAVAGAGGGATQSLRYTDSSGAQLAETVLAAATGSKLYVVEVLTPAGYADDNADLLASVVHSLQITGNQ